MLDEAEEIVGYRQCGVIYKHNSEHLYLFLPQYIFTLLKARTPVFLQISPPTFSPYEL